jgi:hypothetical protein
VLDCCALSNSKQLPTFRRMLVPDIMIKQPIYLHVLLIREAEGHLDCLKVDEC